MLSKPCIILSEGISVQLTVMLYSTFGDGISGVHTYYGGYATRKEFVSCHQSTHRKHPDCIKKIAFASDVLSPAFMIIVWPLEDIVRMIPVKSYEQF